ncbi:MAG: hypothetical protein LBG95_01045 [Treponema sp.]|nr:hypothetical protein [Treponema sp.]
MKALYTLIFLSLICFAGCSSQKPIAYAFAEDEMNSASIDFLGGNPGVSFVQYNDDGLPPAKKRTIWKPLLFPAREPLEITVHAYYFQKGQSAGYNPSVLGIIVAAAVDAATADTRMSRSVDTDVIFYCPPLGPGRKYALSLRKGPGAPGKNILVLVDKESKVIFSEQEFTPVPKTEVLEQPHSEMN